MSGELEPPYGARDPGDMLGRIQEAGPQILRAVERHAPSQWRLSIVNPHLVLVGGMGGSSMAAELAAALESDRLPRPMIAVRDDHWPAFVDDGSLALVCSYSGDTDEALALYRAAGAQGIPRAAITSGGTLAAWCARDGVPCAMLEGPSPPRAALYQFWVALSSLLAALGWTDDPRPRWRAVAKSLAESNADWAIWVSESANPGKLLARRMHGRFPFIYGASERIGPVVTRWRNQINENAKLLGHSGVGPELNHNEIVGWERSSPLMERAAVVILRDAEDSGGVSTGLDFLAEIAARRAVPVETVSAPEGERLARMVALIQRGDFVSGYLALLNGADPTPIETIAEFKRRVAERKEQRAR